MTASGRVELYQTLTDPGDIGEPRVVQADGVTYIAVPHFDLWPAEDGVRVALPADLTPAEAQALIERLSLIAGPA